MNELSFDGNAMRTMKSWLPESVRHLAELVGWDATAALVDRFGGSRFPIGRGIQPHGEARISLLLSVLTPEQVQRVMHTFGGDSTFCIPRCDEARREWRNRLFLRDLSAAVTAGESRTMALTYLCPRYGIGHSRAWQIISEYGLPRGDSHESAH